MTDKKRKPLKEFWRQTTENVRNYLESRTRRQRLTIISIMLFALLLADIWIIVRSVSGRRPVKIDRIERFEIPGPINTNPTEETGEAAQESEDSETKNK